MRCFVLFVIAVCILIKVLYNMRCFFMFVIAVCILFLFKQRFTRFIALMNSKQLKFRTLALLFFSGSAYSENAKLQLSVATVPNTILN